MKPSKAQSSTSKNSSSKSFSSNMDNDDSSFSSNTFEESQTLKSTNSFRSSNALRNSKNFIDDDFISTSTQLKITQKGDFSQSESSPFTPETKSKAIIWKWQTDNENWESYSMQLNEIIEAAFLSNSKTVKIDNERFIDFNSMRQKRYDNPTRTRIVKRDEETVSTKFSTFISPKVNSKKEQTLTTYKSPTGSEFKPTKTPLSVNSAKWYWQSDNGWVAYSSEICSALEEGYQTKCSQVKVDEWRYVDLERMFQCRYDNPSLCRSIRRDVEAVDVLWYWQNDSGIWIEYGKVISDRIEEQYSKGLKEINVDDQRYIDVDSMMQRRYDNSARKRYVKRRDARTIVIISNVSFRFFFNNTQNIFRILLQNN